MWGTVEGPSAPRRPSSRLRDCTCAIDGFAAVCCCYGVTVDADGRLRVHAPYGYDDLFSLVVRSNPHSPAPRDLYEAGAQRWGSVWPELTVLR